MTGTPLADDVVIGYWELLFDDPETVARRITGTPNASGALIVEALAHCTDNPAEPGHGALAAATNPACPLELLEGWLTAGTYRVQHLVARNPAVGHLAAVYWDRLDAQSRLSFLRNPAVGSSFLATHWDRHARWAAQNPALPRHLLTEQLGADTEPGYAAYANPQLTRAELRTGLTSTHPRARLYAGRNPNVTEADLRELRNRELWSDDLDQNRLDEATVRLEHIRWQLRPHEASVPYMLSQQLHPTLARQFAPFDRTARDAVRALLATRFTGTVGELLNVAVAVAA